MLSIRGLHTHYAGLDGRPVPAVRGVNVDVAAGRTLCLVGESGCGKSTVALSILQLVEPAGRIVAGEIWWRPADHAEAVDLAALETHGERLRRVRGGEIGMVFQEAVAALSPQHPVGAQLVEAIRLHERMSRRDARDRALDLLRRVGVPEPHRRFDAYSFQLSGGQAQRIMIAIALACGPSLLIADEPTTSLDVTMQARILDLLAELREERGMGLLFITHDLGVVAEIADDVAVMYLGTVVERGTVDDIFHRPRHPYTIALLRSLPVVGAGRQHRLDVVSGSVPDPARRPAGCPFHPRCPHAIAGRCDTVEPPFVDLGGGRAVRCVLAEPAMPS